jgi:hypothetical protein
MPRSGDVVRLDACDDGGANVPWSFAPILYRIIRVHDWPTWEGTVWLDGYALNRNGDAAERRSVYTRIDGIHPVHGIDPMRRNTPAARIPRPRPATEPATTGSTR